MRLKILLATVLAIVASLILPAGAKPSAAPAAPAQTRRDFRWARYDARFGSGRMPLSGTAHFGLADPDDPDSAARSEAIPAGVIPPLPRNFAPNVLVSQDLSSTPHNETSVAVNPKNPANIVVGANDYSLGFGSSGFYSTTDGGKSWRGGIIPFPTVWFDAEANVPCGDNCTGLTRQLLALDGGGDPALAFDRAGTVYYADIQFHRYGCASAVLVYRSINAGVTWSRPLSGAPSAGDPRTPGDGVPVINDNENDCSHFYDKEWIATGPRPAGAEVDSKADTKHLSPDRLYVTWTDFFFEPGVVAAGIGPPAAVFVTGKIMMSYSDDQGRHFTAPKAISGTSTTICTGGINGGCDHNQGSVPLVNPKTGKVYVYFFNSDTAANAAQGLLVAQGRASAPDQLLVVASADGGTTWDPPAKVDTVTDENLPDTGLSNTTFRWTPFGNITLDARSGRLYSVWSDNRNGNANDTDTDVFISSSPDGVTWSPSKRVNTDKTKSDQFFPWAGVGSDGIVHVSFLDRSRDKKNHDIGTTLCVSSNRAASFTCQPSTTGTWNPDRAFRGGFFIGDYTGLATGPFGSFAAFPDARRATPVSAGDNPPALFAEVVGAYAVNFVTPKARGHWVDVRKNARPIRAGAPLGGTKPDSRSLWASIALLAALMGMAALPAARRRKR